MNTDSGLLTALSARVAIASTRIDAKEVAVPIYPPATPAVISATEAELGFSIHPFLRRLYAEIGNGGFGPGYGLVGLAGGYRDSDGGSLVRLYREFRTGQWPEKLLPLFTWGDAIWSCLDGESSEGIIVSHDDIDGPTATHFTIRSWLDAWTNGVDLWDEIYEDTGEELAGTNPFTRQPMVIKAPQRARGRRKDG